MKQESKYTSSVIEEIMKKHNVSRDIAKTVALSTAYGMGLIKIDNLITIKMIYRCRKCRALVYEEDIYNLSHQTNTTSLLYGNKVHKKLMDNSYCGPVEPIGLHKVNSSGR